MQQYPVYAVIFNDKGLKELNYLYTAEELRNRQHQKTGAVF